MRTENLIDYRFSKDHEWILPGFRHGEVGITDYAQKSLGDMVYVDLPKVGDKLERNEAFASVESVKAVNEVYSPVSCEVIAINNALSDRPELLNEDPYGAGWIIKVRPTAETEIGALLNLIQYRAEVLQEVEHVLYLDEANRIHYLPAVRGEDGRVIVNTKSLESVLTGPLIAYPTLHKLAVIEEFEYLINKSPLKENELQRFFQEHPEFLLGNEYDSLHSQVVLKQDGTDDLRPDFILKPLAGVSYQPNIVELKLPGDQIIKPTPRREGLYANVYEALMQLRAYARYFNEETNREYVREVLGFTAYRPRLTLVVGRTVTFADENVKADILEAIQPVELVTYNDLLRKYKRLVGV
jgi:glycine cleavage system H protein